MPSSLSGRLIIVERQAGRQMVHNLTGYRDFKIHQYEPILKHV